MPCLCFLFFSLTTRCFFNAYLSALALSRRASQECLNILDLLSLPKGYFILNDWMYLIQDCMFFNKIVGKDHYWLSLFQYNHRKSSRAFISACRLNSVWSASKADAVLSALVLQFWTCGWSLFQDLKNTNDDSCFALSWAALLWRWILIAHWLLLWKLTEPVTA